MSRFRGAVAALVAVAALAVGLVSAVRTPHAEATASAFATLPPGSPLPSDQQCASLVRRSSWEPRPGNYKANHTVSTSVSLPGFTPSDGGVDARSRVYADRVTGNFTGTTDEIIQWASCKWGFNEDITRAVAVAESNWHQSTLGDYTSDPARCQAGYTPPCPESFGLLQIKATVHRGTFPSSRDATAFNVDYVLMQRRICYEGWVDWLGYWFPQSGYAAGDEWGCVGFHYSGGWKDAGAINYTNSVRQHLEAKRWLQPGFATPPPTPIASGGGGTFTPVAPARILDTRTGTGQGDRVAKVGPGQTITLDVTGAGGVPAEGVTAVTLNVTVTEASAASFLSVTPSGGNTTSNLNFTPGQDRPNLVTVPVGADGNVRIYNNSGSTHVVADVSGWYGASGGARYNPVAPARVLDTRNGDGQGGKVAKVGPGQTITVDVTGPGGVPASGVSAVTMNVTATEASAASFLSVTPAGGRSTSNLNFTPGRDTPNLVTVPVGADGNVRIYNNSGSTHVLADVAGWYTTPGAGAGALYNPVSPARVVDTRIGTGTAGARTPLGPGQTLTADVTGVGGVPASGVSAVVVNVTVTQPSAHSFVSVTPNGGRTTSNLNFVPGQDVPNLVVVPVGADGNVRAYNNAGSTHIIFDVVGWFSA